MQAAILRGMGFEIHPEIGTRKSEKRSAALRIPVSFRVLRVAYGGLVK